MLVGSAKMQFSHRVNATYSIVRIGAACIVWTMFVLLVQLSSLPTGLKRAKCESRDP